MGSMTNVRIKQNGVDHFSDIVNWCTEIIGFDQYTVDFNFPSDYILFKFPNNANATFFKLRWYQ